MDQNATLDELRALSGTRVLDSDDLERFQDLFSALDTWLSAGNALPEDWARREPPAGRVIVDVFE